MFHNIMFLLSIVVTQKNLHVEDIERCRNIAQLPGDTTRRLWCI